MAIDFDHPQISNRQTRVDAVRGAGRAIFHPESSNFEASRFGLKFSFRGGTYLVRGTYHTTVMSHLTDDQVFRAVDFVSIDPIRTYRNGGYIPSRLSKHEEVELTRATYAAVRDPYTNPFLTVMHNRNSLA
jgi:hypothetical protein